MYTKGDFINNPQGGYDIEILDPDGNVICELYAPAMYKWNYAEQILNEKADSLLSHLNR